MDFFNLNHFTEPNPLSYSTITAEGWRSQSGTHVRDSFTPTEGLGLSTAHYLNTKREF